MAGYDDTDIIERIRKAMLDDASLSQRAAIMKMRKLTGNLPTGMQAPPEEALRAYFRMHGPMTSMTGTVFDRTDSLAWIRSSEGKEQRTSEYGARIGDELRLFWIDGIAVLNQNLTTGEEFLRQGRKSWTVRILEFLTFLGPAVMMCVYAQLPAPSVVADMFFVIVLSYSFGYVTFDFLRDRKVKRLMRNRAEERGTGSKSTGISSASDLTNPTPRI